MAKSSWPTRAERSSTLHGSTTTSAQPRPGLCERSLQSGQHQSCGPLFEGIRRTVWGTTGRDARKTPGLIRLQTRPDSCLLAVSHQSTVMQAAACSGSMSTGFRTTTADAITRKRPSHVRSHHSLFSRRCSHGVLLCVGVFTCIPLRAACCLCFWPIPHCVGGNTSQHHFHSR